MEHIRVFSSQLREKRSSSFCTLLTSVSSDLSAYCKWNFARQFNQSQYIFMHLMELWVSDRTVVARLPKKKKKNAMSGSGAVRLTQWIIAHSLRLGLVILMPIALPHIHMIALYAGWTRSRWHSNLPKIIHSLSPHHKSPFLNTYGITWTNSLLNVHIWGKVLHWRSLTQWP